MRLAFNITEYPGTAILRRRQDQGFVLPCDMTEYRKKVMKLREAYSGKMEVLYRAWSGNICSDAVRDGFDYWIGSVHYLQPEKDRYYPVVFK